MPKDPLALVFVGIRGCVVALNRESGEEVWRAELGSDYVTVLWDGDSLFAATSGEVTRLDPSNGGMYWHNPLKGLGRGLVTLASNRATLPPSGTDATSEYRRRAAQAAAAAG